MKTFRIVVGFVLWLASSLAAEDVSRPNILFIMIDDLGWMDLACQGNPLVETPNIDRLGTQGVRFTDAYAAAPVCSPSRAAILTGMSPARLRITNHTPDRPSFTPKNAVLASAKMHNELALDYKTIAEYLGDSGVSNRFSGEVASFGTREGRHGVGPVGSGIHTEHWRMWIWWAAFVL